MATIYVLLDPAVGREGIREFTDAVENNAGRLVVFLPPQVAVVDGSGATNDALQSLVGGTVVAIGFEEVASLALAAFGSPELTRLVGLLALTTDAAVAAADLVRPLEGEEWRGFGCVPEDF